MKKKSLVTSILISNDKKYLNFSQFNNLYYELQVFTTIVYSLSVPLITRTRAVARRKIPKKI